MTVRKRGSNYQVDLMISGVRHRRTFKTFEEASQHEVDLILGKVPEQAGLSPTFEDMREHVIKTTWGRSRGSQAQISNSKHFMEWFGPKRHVKEVTKLELERYKTFCLDHGDAVGTVNRRLAAIGKILTEALEHGLIDRKPKLPKGKEMAVEIRFLTPSEEERLVAQFHKHGLEDWVHFVAFAADTGLRLGEIMRLRWEHISGTVAHVWETKSNKPRSVPLTRRAQEALRAMQEAHPVSAGPWHHFSWQGALQPNLRSQWERITQEVRINKRIHDLRHTCASRLVQRGVDILRVKDFLGHADVSTTLRYAHLAPNDLDTCRKALET